MTKEAAFGKLWFILSSTAAASDGPSETSEASAACCGANGKPAPLPAPALSYPDSFVKGAMEAVMAQELGDSSTAVGRSLNFRGHCPA